MSAEPPLIVLDTNVLLDWLVFDDTNGRAVGEAIVSGAFTWIATAAMRDEQFEVIGRKALARWQPNTETVRRAWETHCRLRPAPAAIADPIRSADPDDQMFVDLARSEGAAFLLSRDRALLDLAPALRSEGIRVVTPAAWVAAHDDRAS